MTENYDTSWDLIESNKGNLPDDEDAYERKYQEWMERDWMPWLREHLSFPFRVKRMEDEDDAYFTDVAKRNPFRLGHIMEVIGIESEEDDLRGVIVHMKEVKKKDMFHYAILKSLPGRIGISGPSGNMRSGLQTDEKTIHWIFLGF